MLLNLSEDLLIAAPQEEVWKLLRDTPRFTGLLPGVESVTRLNEDGPEAYAARVTEKVGPFKITLNVEVRVAETQEPSLLKANVKGGDSMGLNRVTGTLQASLAAAPNSETQMHFEAAIEILGKMATLGAVPIRRRTAESFALFAKNIQAQFSKGNA